MVWTRGESAGTAIAQEQRERRNSESAGTARAQEQRERRNSESTRTLANTIVHRKVEMKISRGRLAR